MESIRIAGIIEESIVDGPGIRFVVFTQGCHHNCIGCHNPETHDPIGGQLIKIDDLIEMIKSNPLLDGITISGGEPFEQSVESSILAKKVQDMGLNVVVYTGYTIEELLCKEEYKSLLQYTDILIDGRYDMTKKTMLLSFRGSTNQRIIFVQEYLKR